MTKPKLITQISEYRYNDHIFTITETAAAMTNGFSFMLHSNKVISHGYSTHEAALAEAVADIEEKRG
jgi:hypothetical protein